MHRTDRSALVEDSHPGLEKDDTVVTDRKAIDQPAIGLSSENAIGEYGLVARPFRHDHLKPSQMPTTARHNAE